MKIQILSDLHLEHDEKFTYEKAEGADLLILAGDISSYIFQSDFVRHCAKQIKTIMIMGNHEPLGYSIKDTVQAWKDLNIDNLIILDNDTVEINGIHFIGTTLWTDLYADPLNHFAIKNNVCDFKKILKSDHSGLIDIIDIQEEFEKSLKFITEEFNKDYKRKVLITHHLPTLLSISEEYINSPMNASFASNLSNLLAYTENLELCIHGHTHHSFDYMLNENIRIVCNPRGYHDSNKDFNPVKTVDL